MLNIIEFTVMLNILLLLFCYLFCLFIFIFLFAWYFIFKFFGGLFNLKKKIVVFSFAFSSSEVFCLFFSSVFAGFFRA